MAKAKRPPTRASKQKVIKAPPPPVIPLPLRDIPLVHQKFTELARDLVAGGLKIHEPETIRQRDRSESRVPRALLPFIEAPSIASLAMVLRAQPRLYWHPLVERQVRHLVELRWQARRFGHKDPDLRRRRISEAQQALEELLRVHATSLLPWKRIELKQRPGRKTEIPNPYPTGDPDHDEIDISSLSVSFEFLRWNFKRALPAALKLGGTVSEASRQRIVRITHQVLKKGDSVSWSSLGLVERWDFRKERLRKLPLRAAVDRLFDERHLRNRLEKDGVPAWLARTVLAVLLGVTAEKVRNKLERFPQRYRSE